MNGPRIGSLCSGAGLLDLAVMDAVPGAEVAWHAQYDPDDKHQYAARILAHRWPGVPNLGDITAADWFEAEPIDILTAGYPCQPISYAGKGLVTDDARWIWPAVAQCIRLLRPGLVFLENVAAHVVRGLADVVADLARLGYVKSWLCLRASDVGAPHQRKRLFILARPADADTANLGHQRGWQARGRRSGSTDGGIAVAHAERLVSGHDSQLQAGRHALRNGLRPDAAGRGQASADTEGDGRNEGRPEPAGIVRGPDAAVGGSAAAADADSDALRQQPVAESGGSGQAGPGFPCIQWGAYGPAVRRWESVLGRSAPAPTDEHGRLAPPFVEWMMGAPAGWVTDVPAIPRSAQLKVLGNGVVRQQGAEAFRILSQRLAAP